MFFKSGVEMNEATEKANKLRRVLLAAAAALTVCMVSLAAGKLYERWLARPQEADIPQTLVQAAEPQTPKDSGPAQAEAQMPQADPANDSQNRGVYGREPGSGRQPQQEKGTGLLLSLYNDQAAQNTAFAVYNMLPGDCLTQYFCVRTYHEVDIPLYFCVENIKDSKNLREVLKLRIVRMDTGAVLCDAPVRDIAGCEFSQTLLKNAANISDVWYSVTAYMDASVGNEYQRARLSVDFKWYCKESESTGSLSGIPQTGGLFPLWLVLGEAGLVLLLLALVWAKKEKQRAKQAAEEETLSDSATPPVTRRAIWKRLIAVFVLGAMLAATSFALMLISVSVPDNAFETAAVSLDLNGGKPVFDGLDLLLEPGRTILRDFDVTNQSTVDVYCRLYLQKLEGPLSSMVVFSLYEGDKLLFEANAVDFDRTAPYTLPETLAPGEVKTLTLAVKMEETAGNRGQGTGLMFNLSADAVQARSNPNQAF